MTGTFLVGWLGAYLRQRYGQRVESVVDREVEAQSLRAIINFRKPPDPEESPKEKKRKEVKRRKKSMNRLGKLLMLTTMLPALVSGRERMLRNELQAFAMADGTLNTQSMPLETCDKVLGALAELPTSFLGGRIDTSDGVVDSGASSFGTHVENDFIPGT